MIHNDANASSNAFWQMVRYAQECGGDAVCRGTILAALGEEQFDIEVARQRDQEEGNSKWERRDIGKHAKTLAQLLQYHGGQKMTMNMLVKVRQSQPFTRPSAQYFFLTFT